MGTLLFSLISFSSHADKIPMNNTILNVSFDKRRIPAKVIIWNALSGGESPSNPTLLVRNTLTCLSDSDTTYGACKTKPVYSVQYAFDISKIITLKFCYTGDE